MFSHKIKIFPIYVLFKHNFRYFVQKTNKYGTVIENIDEFTSRLSQEKSDKWDSLSKRLVQLDKPEPPKPFHLVNKINILNNYSKNVIENIEDFTTLVDYCLHNRTKIVKKTMMMLIAQCGHYGDKRRLLKLIELGKENNVFNENSCRYCDQYLGEAAWIAGNVQEAIFIFKELYYSNYHLRTKISLLVRFLIERTSEKRTEAILVQIRKFAEELSIDYNDFVPLCGLWQICILSEWFSDQSTAIELLEHNSKLRDILSKKYKFVVTQLLKQNKTEVVQRLLEVFLTHNMEEEYIPLLRQMFDYYYYQRDYRHCAEIIRWSIELDIPLRNEQNAKFVNVLLNQYGAGEIKNDNQPKPRITPQFKLKF